MYRYIFGPVPSRRLGISLGIDLIPKKFCTLDCVYCEVGKTTHLTTTRREYIKTYKILQELDDFMSKNPKPDFITFSGSGEPTLNMATEEIIRYIKTRYSGIPVAVLTNGTLLYDTSVRKTLLQADVVLPSLDAATEKAFEKINRPAKELNLEKYIDGLVAFRKEYKGKIWLEVFILPGYNDDAENLEALKNAIMRIQPDSVQLNTLDRPGTVPELKPAPIELLENIAEQWQPLPVEIIAKNHSRKSNKAYNSNVENTIWQTISRRPCTIDDLSEITGLHVNELNKYLDQLEADGKIETETLARGTFYKIKNP